MHYVKKQKLFYGIQWNSTLIVFLFLLLIGVLPQNPIAHSLNFEIPSEKISAVPIVISSAFEMLISSQTNLSV